jgi:hypothetical protein
VQGVLSVEFAILVELQFTLDVLLVLTGCIIPAIALTALQGNELNRFRLRHPVLSSPLFSPILALQKYSKNPLYVSMA